MLAVIVATFAVAGVGLAFTHDVLLAVAFATDRLDTYRENR